MYYKFKLTSYHLKCVVHEVMNIVANLKKKKKIIIAVAFEDRGRFP